MPRGSRRAHNPRAGRPRARRVPGARVAAVSAALAVTLGASACSAGDDAARTVGSVVSGATSAVDEAPGSGDQPSTPSADLVLTEREVPADGFATMSTSEFEPLPWSVAALQQQTVKPVECADSLDVVGTFSSHGDAAILSGTLEPAPADDEVSLGLVVVTRGAGIRALRSGWERCPEVVFSGPDGEIRATIEVHDGPPIDGADKVMEWTATIIDPEDPERRARQVSTAASVRGVTFAVSLVDRDLSDATTGRHLGTVREVAAAQAAKIADAD